MYYNSMRLWHIMLEPNFEKKCFGCLAFLYVYILTARITQTAPFFHQKFKPQTKSEA